MTETRNTDEKKMTEKKYVPLREFDDPEFFSLNIQTINDEGKSSKIWTLPFNTLKFIRPVQDFLCLEDLFEGHDPLTKVTVEEVKEHLEWEKNCNCRIIKIPVEFLSVTKLDNCIRRIKGWNTDEWTSGFRGPNAILPKHDKWKEQVIEMYKEMKLKDK